MDLTRLAPNDVTVEAGGHAKGVAVALVTDNKDPQGFGRVKVRYPWHERPMSSHWARIATPMAGGDRGAWFLPEVDEEVLVAFERGDVRFPYVVGGLWNGEERPPETNSDGANDLRLIRSRKGHVLLFDDGARGRIELRLDDGKVLEINDDGLRLDDGAGNSLAIDSRAGAIEIAATATLTLKAPSITLEASADMSVTSGATMTIQSGLVSIN